MEKLPERNELPNVTIINKPRKSGAFVDGLLTVLIVFVFIALIASYFVVFDMSAGFSVKELTFNTLWFAVGTVSVGMLTKKIAKNKGRETEEYAKSDKEANAEIAALSSSGYAWRVAEYCRQYTEKTIKRYREHYLSLVGLSVAEYAERFIGVGRKALQGMVKSKEISREQYKAIRKCDKIKIKEYDPNFILSFNSEIDTNKTPSSMYNTERADKVNTVSSIFTTLFSSVFVCSLVSDIVLNLSKEAVVAAIIKIVMILVNVCFKASFGWTVTRQEIKQNELRASEAKACLEWCKANPKEEKIEC